MADARVDFHLVTLAHATDYDGWKAASKSLIADGVEPGRVSWRIAGQPGDLLACDYRARAGVPAFSVPQAFDGLARHVILHRDPDRFSLLYTLLFRLQREQTLMRDAADPLMQALHLREKAIRRDLHKMRAFVRFRELDGQYIAWFEPDHHIVAASADFFVRRFTGMIWTILTPEASIHWDGTELHHLPGAEKSSAPDGDPLEAVWKTYYASIFNPARLKIKAMTKEMPKRYWKNMPETALIPELVAGAQAREAAMVAQVANAPARADSLDSLKLESAQCVRCPLGQCPTQTVFGTGPTDARIMLVGEQPGDQEDQAGVPFIGPAGQILDQALRAASLDRGKLYLTNAVKHFKFVVRGKRRLHQAPTAGEIDLCRWWLDGEIALVRPTVIVAMGRSAWRGLTGRFPEGAGVMSTHASGATIVRTVHPSYVLRLSQSPDQAAQALADLTKALAEARLLAAQSG